MSTAVVTGASTGIGLATTLRLAADHDVVWAACRNPEGAQELQAVLAEGAPGDVRTVRLDVDDDESVAAAFAKIAETSGPVDVLVNNAGVSGAAPLEELDLAELRRQMETNVFGLVRTTQAVVGSMRERRTGAIVNVGSLAGRFVRPGMAAYAATKHAVEAITEALAQELAPFGVRVAVVEPGVVLTAIWGKSTPPPGETAYPHATEKTLAYFGRMLREPTAPEVVAEVIATAVSTDEPKLRYPVGWEAESIVSTRARLADEELVAMAALDLDDWKAAWAEAFGFSLD